MTTRLWVVTGTGGTAFTAAAVTGGALMAMLRLLVVGVALAMVVAYDLSERRSPNRIVLSATVLCFLLDATGNIEWGALVTALAIVAGLLMLALCPAASAWNGHVKLVLLIAAGIPIGASRALASGS